MSKDWTGNTQSVMATLNASNHSENDRAEFDYYSTPRLAVTELLRLESFDKDIWEPACGENAITNVLEEYGLNVRSSDIVNRGEHEIFDFLKATEWHGDIITNPPFAIATDFIEKALEILPDGAKIAFFLRIQFLEGVRRRKLFNIHPPKRVIVASRTMRCAKNGDFANATGNASTYCWFIFVKGNTKPPTVSWMN